MYQLMIYQKIIRLFPTTQFSQSMTLLRERVVSKEYLTGQVFDRVVLLKRESNQLSVQGTIILNGQLCKPKNKSDPAKKH